MRLLVCGDRNWKDQAFIDATLDQIHSETPVEIVIEGEARGADKMSRVWAESRLNIAVMPFPAQWDKYGKAAGPIRNREQFAKGKPDLVVAFHDSIETSKGTKDMIVFAKSKGCPTKVFKHEPTRS